MLKLTRTTLSVAASAVLITGLLAQAKEGVLGLSPKDPMNSAAQVSSLALRSVLVAAAQAGQRLVTVGERGHVLTSDDQGKTWQQADVPVSVTLTSVHFVDDKNGWAVGHSGVILRTQDGGSHWVKQLDGRQALTLMQQSAAQSGDPDFQQRTERQIQDGPDKPFLAVHFSDARQGLAVGAYGLAFETRDGGRTWTPAQRVIPNPDERHLYAIHERADGLYLAGEQGLVWRRAPGGDRFEALKTPFESTVFDLLSSPDGALLAVGLGGKVHRSVDQGRSWQSVQPSGKAALIAGAVVKGALVLVSEAGQLLVSRDGGLKFEALQAPPFPAAGLVNVADKHLLVVGPLGVQSLAFPSVTTR